MQFSGQVNIFGNISLTALFSFSRVCFLISVVFAVNKARFRGPTWVAITGPKWLNQRLLSLGHLLKLFLPDFPLLSTWAITARHPAIFSIHSAWAFFFPLTLAIDTKLPIRLNCNNRFNASQTTYHGGFFFEIIPSAPNQVIQIIH